MKVGNVEIVPIVDGTASAPVEAAVAHPDNKAWDCPQHGPDENGRLRFDTGSFLIRIGERVVLIDAGGGPLADECTQTGDMLGNLRRQGVAPEDVTDVCFTHIYWDHVGWSTTDGETTFPGAP